MKRVLKTLAREPVVHFLLAGLALFGASLWHDWRFDPHRIVIDTRVTTMLTERYSSQYGASPTADQLDELVRQRRMKPSK